MAENLEKLLDVTIVIFMAGNLLGMGLDVVISKARKALRDVRFSVLSLVWCFVLCPALAYLLAKTIPMPAPYGVGLILLGMAPCSPFLPMTVKKAQGDLAYGVALMLTASLSAIIFMPLKSPCVLWLYL